MGNVTHQKDVEHELSRWAHILANERFDLLEKIALEMANTSGAKLPPKLRRNEETEIKRAPNSVPQF